MNNEIKSHLLEELKEDSLFLECLRMAGVDNWEGYSYAHSLYREATKQGDLH
jgi:hypothetical protein